MAIIQAEMDGLFTGPVQRVFSTAEDERVCDICGSLDGTIISSDSLPPIHPSCRCVVSYEVV
jgi:hypothetical protein